MRVPALLIGLLSCLLATACVNDPDFSPTEVDFIVARRLVAGSDVAPGMYMDTHRDDYLAIWRSLVSVGSSDRTEESFSSFVSSINNTHDLSSQAVLAVELLLGDQEDNANRVSNPTVEAEALTGCQTAMVLASGYFGAFRTLLPNCHTVWIDYQVSEKSFKQNSNWIVWLVQRFELPDRHESITTE